MATSSPVTLPVPAPDVPLIDPQTGRPTKALFDFAERLEVVVRQLRQEVPAGFSLSTFTTTDLAEGTNRYFLEERVDDRVASLIQNGTGITWSYNDAAGWLIPTVTLVSFSTSNLSEGANLYFTDERAQDAVGATLTDTATIDFTYNDGANTITADVKDNSVTYAKLQDVSATDKLLGRSTAGAGDVEEITCTAAGRALIDDADATAQRATLGLTATAIAATGQLPATATNDDAAAGKVGEYQTAALPAGTPLALTSGVTANLTSLSLTAGDWDVWATMRFTPDATTTVFLLWGGVDLVSATLTASIDNEVIQGFPGAALGSAFAIQLNTPVMRQSFAATTTVYLNVFALFGTAAMNAYGSIYARRRR